MVVNDQNEEDDVETEKKNKLGIVPTTLATIESLTFPLVQEVVVSADIRCKNCQDRVAHIVSRLNGEAESMEISLKEKKVILTMTRRHPKATKMSENERRHATIYKNRANKSSLVKRIFHSSSG
ncbi:putative heavy-metal-associated, heavy metal-associated domain superfamily [Helianthus anomalus]